MSALARQILALRIKPFPLLLVIFLLVLAIAALPASRIAASRLGGIIPWGQARPYRAIAALSVVVVTRCNATP